MENANELENWFIRNHFHQNFIYKKLKSKYKCLLYIPMVDENAIGFGTTLAKAKEEAIYNACCILGLRSNTTLYTLKKEGDKLVLHVKV